MRCISMYSVDSTPDSIAIFNGLESQDDVEIFGE